MSNTLRKIEGKIFKIEESIKTQPGIIVYTMNQMDILDLQNDIQTISGHSNRLSSLKDR